MSNVLRSIAAFAVAPFLPTLLFVLYTDQVLPFVVLVYAYTIALAAGIPTYVVMRRFGATGLRHFLLCGFSVFGLLVFAFSVRSYWSMEQLTVGGVALVQSGELTAAGWARCVYYGVLMGLTAAFGGAIFWAITHWSVFDGTTRRPAVALPVAAVFIVASALVFRSIEWSPYDPTELGCHAGGIGPTRHPSIDLQITEPEWPELTAIFEAVANTFGLSYRNSSETRPGVLNLLYLSMCKDSTFQIMINKQNWLSADYPPDRPASQRGVGIAFYAVGSDDEWKVVAAELLMRLEERWGERVRFVDGSGYFVPKPGNLFKRDVIEGATSDREPDRPQ